MFLNIPVCFFPLERQDLFALCYKKNIHLPGLPDDYYFDAYSVNWLSYNGKLTLSYNWYCVFGCLQKEFILKLSQV